MVYVYNDMQSRYTILVRNPRYVVAAAAAVVVVVIVC